MSVHEQQHSLDSLDHNSNGATAGQVLTADGNGSITWETPSGGGATPNLESVLTEGNTTLKSIVMNSTSFGSYLIDNEQKIKIDQIKFSSWHKASSPFPGAPVYRSLYITSDDTVIGANMALPSSLNVTAFGYRTLFNNNGYSNVAIGDRACSSDTGAMISSAGNIGLGIEALVNHTGNGGIGVGYRTLYGSTSWDSITIGREAGLGGNADELLALGNFAGYSNHGLNLIAIGNRAGFGNEGANVIAIGQNPNQVINTFNDVILIGQDAVATADNQLVLKARNLGNYIITDMPSSDPGVVGALYHLSGVVMISI